METITQLYCEIFCLNDFPRMNANYVITQTNIPIIVVSRPGYQRVWGCDI